MYYKLTQKSEFVQNITHKAEDGINTIITKTKKVKLTNPAPS